MGDGGGGTDHPNGQTPPTDSHWHDYVALTGLIIIGVMGFGIVYFYGTTGETAAAGVLGLAFTAIGSIVGAVFGIGAGTKSGQAAGQQIGASKTQAAKNSLSDNKAALNEVLAGLKSHKSTLAAHAQVISPLIRGQVHEQVQKTLAGEGEDVANLQKQLELAIAKTETAMKMLGA